MTSTTDHMNAGKHKRPITGRTVLIWLICFFSVIFTVNAIFVNFALNTFPGVVSETHYEDGLRYNTEISAAREQAARNWAVSGGVTRTDEGNALIDVTARSNDGAPLVGLSVTAVLLRPASPDAARVLVLQEGESGRYAGTLANVVPGQWILEIDARSGDQDVTFKSRNRIFLSER